LFKKNTTSKGKKINFTQLLKHIKKEECDVLLMPDIILQHPIQRFFAQYVYNSPQQEYEKYMHLLYEEDEKRRLR
jgi:lantibiotic modifying enzyme